LIDLAKRPTNLPVELRTDDRKVNGCMSQIWIDVGVQENNVQVYYDSDAMITKGITSVVADCFSDIPVEEAKAIQKEDFEKLGIKELLTPQRRNGLGSLIKTISTKVQAL
jgi:cysteine desulfuration protein SufE